MLLNFGVSCYAAMDNYYISLSLFILSSLCPKKIGRWSALFKPFKLLFSREEKVFLAGTELFPILSHFPSKVKNNPDLDPHLGVNA